MSHLYSLIASILFVIPLPLCQFFLQLEGINSETFDKVSVPTLLFAAVIVMWRYFNGLVKEAKEEHAKKEAEHRQAVKEIRDEYKDELERLRKENKELTEKLLNGNGTNKTYSL